jgi:hypothetical protein
MYELDYWNGTALNVQGMIVICTESMHVPLLQPVCPAGSPLTVVFKIMSVSHTPFPLVSVNNIFPSMFWIHKKQYPSQCTAVLLARPWCSRKEEVTDVKHTGTFAAGAPTSLKQDTLVHRKPFAK